MGAQNRREYTQIVINVDERCDLMYVCYVIMYPHLISFTLLQCYRGHHFLRLIRKRHVVNLSDFIEDSNGLILLVMCQKPAHAFIHEEHVEDGHQERGVDGAEKVAPVGDLPGDEAEESCADAREDVPKA